MDTFVGAAVEGDAASAGTASAAAASPARPDRIRRYDMEASLRNRWRIATGGLPIATFGCCQELRTSRTASHETLGITRDSRGPFYAGHNTRTMSPVQAQHRPLHEHRLVFEALGLSLGASLSGSDPDPIRTGPPPP
ncbi:hypothetical protein GCM10009742_72640 [Kribbella karoonensis]|uniref:Uncharacterized protein n=1 Tax=Kribbella karoonensis TaxID=324851 RepID=A0ABN2EM13_9ACTN